MKTIQLSEFESRFWDEADQFATAFRARVEELAAERSAHTRQVVQVHFSNGEIALVAGKGVGGVSRSRTRRKK